jgi:hypothetical protein
MKFIRAFYFMTMVVVVTAFMFNLRPFGIQKMEVMQNRRMSLYAKLSIGQSVVAEVDDIGGTLKEPVVMFKASATGTCFIFSSLYN